MIKRRRVPRREFNRRIGVLVRGQYHLERAAQIGEGGMLIYCSQALEIGQKVVLSFKLPGYPPEVVMAVVRYTLQPQMGMDERFGLEFLSLDFNVKREIRNYVAMQRVETDDDKRSSV